MNMFVSDEIIIRISTMDIKSIEKTNIIYLNSNNLPKHSEITSETNQEVQL